MKSLTFVILLGVCSFLMHNATAQATNFAILFTGCGEGGSNEDCDDKDDQVGIQNPLFEGNGNAGDNPLFEGKTDLLIFNPIQFASAQDVELQVSFGDSISTKVPPVPGGSLIFQVNILDVATGQYLTSFPNGVDISFSVPKLARLHKEGIVHRDLAFRTLNTSVSPPVWEVMPSGVKTKDGNFCGTTDHFSIFAFGAVPEPSSLVLVALGGAGMLWRRR
jgi:hypothetical protein